MKLILIRHGNTFESGETAYWVGATNDLPLTRRGLNQAAAVGKELTRFGLRPSKIFCGPLARHTAFAGVLSFACDGSAGPISTPLLNELDYGLWSGMTDEQIVKLGMDVDFQRWRDDGTWPQNSLWGESDLEVLFRVKHFLEVACTAERADGCFAAVTSSGLLRYFLRFCGPHYLERLSSNTIKVATGNYCILEGERFQWSATQWNVRPSE